MNRLLAVMMFIVLLPLILIIVILIKLDSKGPAIFVQRRVGLNGDYFNIYKFRTMQTGMPDLPSDQVGENDPRFTYWGKWLRRFSIDEIPQLVNIIKGDMDFIGPRPALHNQFELIEMRKARDIDKIKPGITGWAQVNGRDTISMETKVCLDEYYLLHQSFLLDLRILWMTFFKTAVGEGIYCETSTTPPKNNER